MYFICDGGDDPRPSPGPIGRERTTCAERSYWVCVKKTTSKQQKRLRCGDYKVKLADHSTFLGKERNACSESGRVDGYVFASYKQCSHVLDGSQTRKNNHEAIRVQTSSQNMDGVWCGNDEWGTIERFKFDKKMIAKSAGFVQFQSRHYGDLRKRDTHFDTIGGADLRAWNRSVVGEYAPTRGGSRIMK